MNDSSALWKRFQKYYREFPSTGMALDVSRMGFSEEFLSGMKRRMRQAFLEMRQLEAGAISNPDEKRMVGHYWLRKPELAPTQEIRQAIERTQKEVAGFAQQVHKGKIRGRSGSFTQLLLIGIGGSALGPQFVSQALSSPGRDKMAFYCLDNTDPDGIQRVLQKLKPELGRTLCLVVSKSGGTKETRNGMLEAKAFFENAKLRFEDHAVAVTKPGSELDHLAEKSGWLKRFPMWDWVGGRTSELSAVGLLPAALQGFDIAEMIRGAKLTDELTRSGDLLKNPAALLAAMWYYAGNGKGKRDMVILPYKDRLEFLPRYLQQLVMESLGKELDRDAKRVEQGISVFGNKGSTDQHAYVQQLRDGIDNFFVTFIEVLKDQEGRPLEVSPATTSGDYLFGFLLGTRAALSEKGRNSITLTIQDVSPFSIGGLIALFERTVGFYASLVNINAYHQPGVEAGKKAAEEILALQKQVLQQLQAAPNEGLTIRELMQAIGNEASPESIFRICEHLAANNQRGVKKSRQATVWRTRYRMA